MKAAIDLVMGIGLDKIAARMLDLKKHLVAQLEPMDFEIIPPSSGANASGITTFRHPRASMEKLFKLLEENGIVASLRYDRAGTEYIRLSPHFYNTSAEIDRVMEVRHARDLSRAATSGGLASAPKLCLQSALDLRNSVSWNTSTGNRVSKTGVFPNGVWEQGLWMVMVLARANKNPVSQCEFRLAISHQQNAYENPRSRQR